MKTDYHFEQNLFSKMETKITAKIAETNENYRQDEEMQGKYINHVLIIHFWLVITCITCLHEYRSLIKLTNSLTKGQKHFN